MYNMCMQDKKAKKSHFEDKIFILGPDYTGGNYLHVWYAYLKNEVPVLQIDQSFEVAESVLQQ